MAKTAATVWCLHAPRGESAWMVVHAAWRRRSGELHALRDETRGPKRRMNERRGQTQQAMPARGD